MGANTVTGAVVEDVVGQGTMDAGAVDDDALDAVGSGALCALDAGDHAAEAVLEVGGADGCC